VEYFAAPAAFVEDLKAKRPTHLAGLGEVPDAKQKAWVKEKMPDEPTFLLLSTKGWSHP